MITPGIARNATFAASITVDCRIHQRQNGRGPGSSWTYIKNEVRPFRNQLLHEIPPESLNDDVIRPQVLEFPQMGVREEETHWG